ncbi:MAG TPA: carbonic anhydrase [Candidatus Dormibacteraeota bacterium]|nr:carbonic anhydrase [Candidatus Dormibacteraeota bacterium]
MPPRPARGIAVITCMDTRVDPAALLGLLPGDAHVIRNAGGVVTDDVLRSLELSQTVLGTERVVVIQHTDCALPLRNQAEATASVRAAVRGLRGAGVIPRREHITGLVFDVATGGLTDVEDETGTTATLFPGQRSQVRPSTGIDVGRHILQPKRDQKSQ